MNEFVLAGYSAGQGRSESARVTSAEQMAALLDDVQALGRPVWVELSVPGNGQARSGGLDSAVLDVALGAGFGSLTFYEPGTEGSRYDSAGTLSSPQDAEFDYGGTPTSMETGSAIKVEEARAAALEFLTTGRRPESVAWKLFDPPPAVDNEPFSWDEILD